MRCLAEGSHVVYAVNADGKPADAAITVRAIPEIIYANCYDHHIPQYGEQNTYFNFVRLFFRAKAETARLAISDWVREKDAGGPDGQELMFNFVEVEPYLEE